MPYTPGVDEAVMSRYAVLTPAAWQDFAAYVQQLEAGGHHGRASTLASSVVEIRHAGHGLPGGSAGVLRPSCGLPPHPLGAMPGGRVPSLPRGTRWVSFSLDWGVESSALCYDAWRYRGSSVDCLPWQPVAYGAA